MNNTSNLKPLVFLGTNGVLERYIEAAERQGQPVAGIIDSDWYGNRDTFADIPVIANNTDLERDIEHWRRNYVFFVGTNWIPSTVKIKVATPEQLEHDRKKRSYYCDLVENSNLGCINLIDPNSYVSRYATLGQGIFIGANVSVEPYTVIENFAQLWSGISVGHHSHIGRNTVLQRDTGLYGRIGKNSWVGLGTAIVRDGTSVVGDDVVFAPGLFVYRDVESGEHVSMDTKAAKVYRRVMPV